MLLTTTGVNWFLTYFPTSHRVSSWLAQTVLPLVLGVCFLQGELLAKSERPQFRAGGYFRLATRPDFQGGNSRLGLWNISGRLLNEGPWGALELHLDIQPREGSRVWSAIHTKIEGDSFLGADVNGGNLQRFRVTQLYLQAGNLLLPSVTWQVGTLDSYFGDLSLYDIKPAQIFYNTMGVSGRYKYGGLDILVGVGDSGYALRGDNYNTIFTTGGSVRWSQSKYFKIGVGAESMYEPAIDDNPNAPHTTALPDNASYEDYYRGEILERFLELKPNREQEFLRTKPNSVSASSYKLVGYIGWGNIGPLKWSNLYWNYRKLLPDNFHDEFYNGTSYKIYDSSFTDERFELNVGNEMHLTVVPGLIDALWGVLYGKHRDYDNTVAASEANRDIYSTVLRSMIYITETSHLLLEGSLAREYSLQGNLWRTHYDSIFRSTAGLTDRRGLEYGDINLRETWQLKTGVVLNPKGKGMFSRPSIRLLYGFQYATMHNAFGNSFATSLSEYERFTATQTNNTHHVIAIEAEGWF